MTRLKNRREAGRLLARKMEGRSDLSNAIVLALPRGGVPVGFEIAKALTIPLDIFIVRKLGVPGQEELALGAIATGGVRVINDEVVRSFDIPEVLIQTIASRESRELEHREQLYRQGRPPAEVSGLTVIVTDDGLATGATMRAAVRALRALGAARIIVAVPVAPLDTYEKLRKVADEVVCLMTPSLFFAIGEWYEDFSQVSDEEVGETLHEAAIELPELARTGSATH